MIPKRSHFALLWFCDEYYVGGVNLLAESGHRTFIKEIDCIISGYFKDFPYRLQKGAKLYEYRINKKKFKLAIATLPNGIYWLIYLNRWAFDREIAATTSDDRKRNNTLLYNFALAHYAAAPSEKYTYVYSESKKKRLRIEQSDGCVKVAREEFTLSPDAELDFPDDILSDPYQYLADYEGDGTYSIYPDIRTAQNDNQVYLAE